MEKNYIKIILFIVTLIVFLAINTLQAQGKGQRKTDENEKKAMEFYQKGNYQMACEYFIEANEIKSNIKSSKLDFAIFIFFLIDVLGLFLFLYLEKRRAYKKLVRKNIEWANRTDKMGNCPDKDFDKLDTKEQQILTKLIYIFTKEKVYLNSEISINDIAKQLGTNRSVISKIINTYFNKTFPSLLNEYRINDAVKLLMDSKSKNYKMEAISEMCGYNNRQVFHSAFKRETGVTPNDFRTMSSRKDIDED